MNIIYEDKDILLVEKPQGVPSQNDKTCDTDMLSLVKEYLDKEDINLVHRLDRPVGGLMIFPKNKKACRNINEDIKLKNISKTYMGVICGNIGEKAELRDYLLKNSRLNTSKVVQKGVPNAKEGILLYETLSTCDTDEYGKLSLIKINLITGRHHQIRVQFSSRGFPLWGDTKYSKGIRCKKGFTNIALWSYELKFNHPIIKKEMEVKLPPHDIFPFNIEKFKVYYS